MIILVVAITIIYTYLCRYVFAQGAVGLYAEGYSGICVDAAGGNCAGVITFCSAVPKVLSGVMVICNDDVALR